MAFKKSRGRRISLRNSVNLAHIRQRLNETNYKEKLRMGLYLQLSPGVGKDAGKQAVDGADEGVGREATIVDDGWIDAVGVGRDGVFVDGGARGPEHGDGVVGCRMRHHPHRDEDSEEGAPDGEVGEEAEVLERADLGQAEADDDEQKRADDVAEAEFGDLTDVLAVLDGDLARDEEEGEGLEEVGHVAGDGSAGAEGQVALGNVC